MKNNKKHIDDLFREKLGSYSEVPPAEAWSELDTKLDTLVPQVPTTSPFRWLGHVGMVSVIAVLSVSLIQKFAGKNNNESNIVKEQTINKLETDNSSVDINNATASVTETQVPGMDGGNDNSDENGQSSAAVPAANNDNGDDDNTDNNEYTKGTSGRNNGNGYNSNAGSKMNRNYNGNSSVAPGENSESNNAAGEYNAEPKTKSEQYNTDDNQPINNDTEPKSAAPKNVAPPIVNNNALQRKAPEKAIRERKPIDFARWSAGIKGGYERGFDNIAATKYVIAPYVQYNISKKVAVMIQPAAKYANSPLRTIGNVRSYYTANNDGQVVNIGNDSISYQDGGVTTYTYKSKLRYTRSHDSIVKSEKAGGKYMEYELPVLVKYNINNKTSVYGGVNMIYSQLTGIKEYTYTKSGIVKMIDTTVSSNTGWPTSPAVNDIITDNGTPLSDYNGPLYPSSQNNRIRFGATVGFTYEYSGRWLLDALIQQNPAQKDVRGGYNINAPLSSTYIRLSVGYKLTK